MAPFVIRSLKPRNPLVQAARFRRAGRHSTSGGALRQQQCREVRAELARLKPSP